MKKASKLFILGITVVVISGCYSVRRKFVRKRKTEKPQPVYVNFKEYPKESTDKLYDNYYLFAGAWIDEIIEGLRGDCNCKRERHAFNEALRNLEEMNNILTEEGKNKLEPLYNEVVKLSHKASPNLTEIDRNFILRKMEDVKLKLDNNFTHSKVSQWIKKK